MRLSYGRSLAISSAVLVCTWFGARLAFEQGGLNPAARVALVLVPVAAFAWFLASELRWVRELDELQQRVQLEALAVSLPLALLLVFGVGLFEAAGLSVPGFTQPRDMWPLVVLPYGLGLWLARRRYL